jgi:outer membrane murein-binding lipoprotein Lpp
MTLPDIALILKEVCRLEAANLRLCDELALEQSRNATQGPPNKAIFRVRENEALRMALVKDGTDNGVYWHPNSLRVISHKALERVKASSEHTRRLEAWPQDAKTPELNTEVTNLKAEVARLNAEASHKDAKTTKLNTEVARLNAEVAKLKGYTSI